MIKLGDMVLKGVNWVPNEKIRLNGLLRQLIFHFTEKSMYFSV